MSDMPKSKLLDFIAVNLPKVLERETKETLGDRSTYVGASDVGGCPFKVVNHKLNPPEVSLKQHIIFQRGHLAEDLVSKMLDGLNVSHQHEALGEIEEFALKAHIDKIVSDKKRCVLIEVKTVSAPVDDPYESWVLQVQYQMGLMFAESNGELGVDDLDAYVLAIDLNSGWINTFKIEFDDGLFELCLSKASHIISALKGECAPKAIIQNYCGSCDLKMQCPKLGQHATNLPADVKADLEFIKKSKEMEKEAKKREERVKNYMLDMDIKVGRDIATQTVVSIGSQTRTNMNIQRFKMENPELYKEYSEEKTINKMTVM